MVDGQYEVRTFTCEQDVWEVVDLIIEETKEMNETSGKSFSPASSVKSQLPFFACNNIIFDKEIQQDIERKLKSDPEFKKAYDNSAFGK